MDMIKTYTEFTAGDAQRITGVGTVQQRDWRRQGFLPPVGGKAKFDASLLAGMIVAKRLADAGIPPSAGWQLARSCSVLAITRLLNSGAGVFDPGALWTGPLIHADGPMPTYAVTEDGQSWGFADDAAGISDHLGLASIVIDLDRVGEQLIQRARKPLVTISQEGE